MYFWDINNIDKCITRQPLVVLRILYPKCDIELFTGQYHISKTPCEVNIAKLKVKSTKIHSLLNLQDWSKCLHWTGSRIFPARESMAIHCNIIIQRCEIIRNFAYIVLYYFVTGACCSYIRSNLFSSQKPPTKSCHTKIMHKAQCVL